MMSSSRNLLVLLRNEFMSERAIEQEMQSLENLLSIAESPYNFCISHELVDRNFITQKKKKILLESRHYRLRPFRFLINKN
jgi:hypothetical protein